MGVWGSAHSLLGLREHPKGRDCMFWSREAVVVIIYSYLWKLFPNKYLFIFYLESGELLNNSTFIMYSQICSTIKTMDFRIFYHPFP